MELTEARDEHRTPDTTPLGSVAMELPPDQMTAWKAKIAATPVLTKEVALLPHHIDVV